MKANDALSAVVGTSHRRIVRVDLYDDGGALVRAGLPVTAGNVSASAVDFDRWSASLTLAGDLFAPQSPRDPLSGLSRHHLRIYVGAEVSGSEELVEVCRVIPLTARVQRSVERVTVEVECTGIAAFLGKAEAGKFAPRAGESCQQMIRRIVDEADPPLWTSNVKDVTTSVPVPLGYYNDKATPLEVIEDLAAMANLATYFDATGALVIRPPLSPTWGPAAGSIKVGTDLASYDQEMGRDFGFANRAEVTFRPVGAGRGSFASTWNYRVSSGAPTAGQVTVSGVVPNHVWRIHIKDASGFDRTEQLDKIERGDLLQLRDTAGKVSLGEVASIANVEDTYYQAEMRIFQGGGLTNGVPAEMTAFVRLVDEVVGTAEWTSAPLRPADAGLVVYRESRTGNPTQEQADARAAAALQASITAWRTTIVQAVPDPRLEPDDDITVVLPDSTMSARVTRVELPLAATELMTVGVREIAPVEV